MSGRTVMQLGRSLAISALLVATFVQCDTKHKPDTGADLTGVHAVVESRLKEINGALTLSDLQPTAVQGVYQALLSSGELLYISEDGKHVFTGDLLSFGEKGVSNQSQVYRAGIAKDKLEKVKDAAIFPATGKKKALLYVFSDVDCGYCKKLHQEIPDLQKKGIEVHYLAFPRSGPGSSSWLKMKSAWCGKESARGEALDNLMQDKKVASATCSGSTSPIKSHYALGRELGVNGTPSLFLEDGRNIPGYRPAADLIKILVE